VTNAVVGASIVFIPLPPVELSRKSPTDVNAGYDLGVGLEPGKSGFLGGLGNR
jgi:hypothetical protein